MEAIDYVKLYRLDQENYQFKREEFLKEFGEEFLEYCKTTPIGRNTETGTVYYYRFQEIVKNFETKFWAISQLKKGQPFTKKLWKAFFAIYVCPYREKHFPVQVNLIRQLKAKSPGKQDSNGRTQN